MSAALLEIEDAIVRRGATVAVDRVSLDVQPGEIVALLGPNGAGKSSLIGAVVGAVPLAAGTIRFDGSAIERLAPWQRARLGIGLCAEGRRVFASLSVRENLIAGTSGGAGPVDRRIDEMLQIFPALREHASAPAWQLSGGQQQMLAVGRALMRDPRLVILDEPTLGLAPALVRDVLATLRRIAAEGRAVLIADQNAAAVLSAADRAFVLQGGRIALQGRAAALRDAPSLADAFLGG
jgi:branched-chain amino acid transport system ATP-binding protein